MNTITATPSVATARHHGFTCPNCGSHYFGTFTNEAVRPGGALIDPNFPKQASVGHCNEHGHTGNGCQFRWNRNDAEMEAKCIYEQTLEEWMADYDLRRQERETQNT